MNTNINVGDETMRAKETNWEKVNGNEMDGFIL
jgi:hypothetical protein